MAVTRPQGAAAFGLYMIAPVKKSVNHSKTLTSMREVQGSRGTTRKYSVFSVRGDSIVEKEFVFCYCLFAVSIFATVQSLNTTFL